MQTPDFSVFFLLFNRLITYDLPESRRADLASDLPRGERGGRVKPGATRCDGRAPAWLGSPANQPRGPRQRPPLASLLIRETGVSAVRGGWSVSTKSNSH